MLCIDWQLHFIVPHLFFADMIPWPLFKAKPTELLTAQTTHHMITTRTFLYWIMTKWAVFDLHACNQWWSLISGDHFGISFGVLSKCFGFFTGRWPVGIFLALEAPHAAADTHHWDWLGRAYMLITQVCRTLRCCCLDNQSASVFRAPLPFRVNFQDLIQLFSHKLAIPCWQEGHQGDIIDCNSTLVSRATYIRVALL